LYLSFSNVFEATSVTHTKRIYRNLLRKESFLSLRSYQANLSFTHTKRIYRNLLRIYRNLFIA